MLKVSLGTVKHRIARIHSKKDARGMSVHPILYTIVIEWGLYCPLRPLIRENQGKLISEDVAYYATNIYTGQVEQIIFTAENRNGRDQ